MKSEDAKSLKFCDNQFLMEQTSNNFIQDCYNIQDLFKDTSLSKFDQQMIDSSGTSEYESGDPESDSNSNTDNDDDEISEQNSIT